MIALAAPYYAGFVAIVLTLVATGIMPRTKWNTQESANNLGRVHMRNATYYAATGQSMRGVHAQERVECFLKWVLFLSIAGAIVLKTRWWFKQSNLIGKAAETTSAKGFDRTAYLHAETDRTLNNSSYPVFAGWTHDELARAFRRRFLIARALVLINAIAIGRMP